MDSPERATATAGGSTWRPILAGLLVTAPLSGCVTALSQSQPTTGASPVAAAPAPAAPAPSPTAPATSPPAGAPVASREAASADGPKVDPAVKPTLDTPPDNLVPSPPVIPPGRGIYPIDLSTALRLASVENPRIAEVRTEVLAALAEQKIARTLLFPTLNAGVTYHGHAGNLQRSSGTILNVDSQALYVGGGARVLAAETVGVPAINITSPLTDAIYEPLAARQRVSGAQFEVAATANEVLLEVATLHLDLMGASAVLAMQRLSESQAVEIAHTVGSFAEVGEGRQSDAERANAEWKLRRAEVQAAEGEVGVASARLARRLNLDPSVRLEPLCGPLAPIDLIPLDVDAETLVRDALRRRPDIAARTAFIGVAEAKVKEEIARPLLPLIWLGFSGGGFGGGSNLKEPLIGNFGGRTDFDVRAIWTFQGLGVGNLALIKRRKAEVGEAVASQMRTINRARQEVAAARALAIARRGQIDVARQELATAEEGFASDQRLIDQNLIRPIEVLNSLDLLAGARVNFVRAIISYNQSQFALWVSLGSPPPPGPPAPPPGGTPPVTTPLHGPLVDHMVLDPPDPHLLLNHPGYHGPLGDGRGHGH